MTTLVRGAEGANIGPGGVLVAPNLIVVAPTGVNIYPQGVRVGASLFVDAPTGVNIQPSGVVVAPIRKIIGLPEPGERGRGRGTG